MTSLSHRLDALRLLRRSSVLLLTLFMLAAAGCDSADDEPTPTTGTISGSISLPAGAGGDIGNTRVALFESIDEFERNIPTFTAATDASGNFSFSNINPGSYFVSAWKDNNNSSDIDGGDYFGVIGTNQIEGFVPNRQQVVAGENTGFNFTILVLPTSTSGVLTGSYSGTTDGVTLSLTLTDNGGSISGSGTFGDATDTFAVSVAGTRNGSTATLQVSSPELVPLTFTGTVSSNGSSFTGNLTGTGSDGSSILIPFTLIRA